MPESVDHGERLARVETELKGLALNLDAGLRRLDDKMDKGFEAVIERQDKTNGSVGELSRWRWLVAGGMGVITFLLGAGLGGALIVLAVADVTK